MLYTIYNYYTVIPSEFSGNQPNLPLEPTPVYTMAKLSSSFYFYILENSSRKQFWL